MDLALTKKKLIKTTKKTKSKKNIACKSVGIKPKKLEKYFIISNTDEVADWAWGLEEAIKSAIKLTDEKHIKHHVAKLITTFTTKVIEEKQK